MKNFVFGRSSVGGISRVSIDGTSYEKITNAGVGGTPREWSLHAKIGGTSIREIIDTKVADKSVREIINAKLRARFRKASTRERFGSALLKQTVKASAHRLPRIVIRVRNIPRSKVAYVQVGRVPCLKVVFLSSDQKIKPESLKKTRATVKMKTRVAAEERAASSVKKSSTTTKGSKSRAKRTAAKARKTERKTVLARRRTRSRSKPADT